MKNRATFVATGFCVVIAAIALGLFVYSSYRDAPIGFDGFSLSQLFPQLEDVGSDQPDLDQPSSDQLVSGTPLPDAQPDNDEQEPESGLLTPPGEDERTVDEGISLVRVAPDGTGVVAGLAPPGSAVKLKSGDTVIDTARASEQGDWAIAIDPPLESGSHLLHVETVTPEGGTRVGGLAAVVELTGRDETPLVALVPYTAEDIEDSAPPELLQEPEAEAGIASQPAGPGVNIRTIQTAEQGTRIQVAGDARGGATVTLEVNDQTTPAVPVSDDAYAVEAGLGPAAERHRLKVTLLDGDGNAVASARIALTRSKIEQTFGNDGLVVVQKGDALWRIAYRTYGKGVRYVTIFEENRDQIANADLIYPDQIFVVPNE